MSKTYTVAGLCSEPEHISPNMSAGYTQTIVPSIIFYDTNGNIVTPTAGLVEYQMTFDKNTYLTVDQGTFLAAESYNSSRKMPNALGPAVYAKVILNGVQGAHKFALTIHRS